MRLTTKASLLGLLTGLALITSVAHAQTITWDGNLIYNNSPDSCNEAALSGFTEGRVLTQTFTHNRLGLNTLLVDPSIAGHNFRPTASSPALCANGQQVIEVPFDGFFQQTNYAGALSPDPTKDWTTGWVNVTLHGDPAQFNLGKPLVTLTGNLTTRTLLHTNNYVLEGRVRVGAGQTLTVQPGTTVFGSSSVTPSFLEIDRGGKLIANGKKDSLIIFTSDLAPSSSANAGDWGGVVINGRACANCANTAGGDSCVSEGGNAGFYGGTNDHDNSGSMTYCQIDFCGFAVALDNELNCLTMNGLGDATQVSYIHCGVGVDDMFEWFGGTINCHHLYGNWSDDDGLDFQMGYRGKVQFAIIQQHPTLLVHTDKGIEGDNNEFNFANPLCRSNPQYANLTLIGTKQNNPSTTLGGQGIHFRRGARGIVINSIVQGFHLCGFDFDDAETVAGGFGPNGNPYCNTTSGVPDVANPDAMALRAFPNPVRESTRISFNLPSAARTSLQVFTLDGRLVDTLANQEFAAGAHEVEWKAPESLSNGLYFYSVTAGSLRANGKLIVSR